MAIQQMLNKNGPYGINVVTSGTGSVTSPAWATSVTVEAIGGGGNGFGNSSTGNRASGGGGRYAISNANISVTGGLTIVYYSVGAAATDSWVNVGTNTTPTAATTGALAKAGTSATSGVAGVGSQTGSIGATTFSGGNGATFSSAGGGGAGQAGAGTLSIGGLDNTDTSTTTNLAGGTGGAYATTTGNPGSIPGGGGSATNSTGTNPAGAIGRARIIFF
jgi:hypothetical protein